MEIKPVLKLRCQVCDWEPPGNASIGEVALLHFQLEHDLGPGGISFNLAVVCSCGRSMKLMYSDTVDFQGFVDNFRCMSCLNTTKVHRGR